MSGINNRVAMVPAGDDVIPSWRALDRTSPDKYSFSGTVQSSSAAAGWALSAVK